MSDDAKSGADAGSGGGATVEGQEQSARDEMLAGARAGVEDGAAPTSDGAGSIPAVGDKPAGEPAKPAEKSPEPAAADPGASNEEPDEDEPSSGFTDRLKAAKAEATRTTLLDAIRDEHPDAGQALASDWFREWSQKVATDSQKALLGENATASDVSRALWAAKTWNSARAKDGAGGGDAGSADADPFAPFRGAKVKTADGTETTVGALLDEFSGESADFLKVMGTIVNGLVGRLNVAESALQSSSQDVQTLKFWNAVRDHHADIDVLRASGAVEKWAKEKGAEYLHLWNTGTAQDVVDIVRAMKRETLSAHKEKHDTAARAQRDQRNAISKTLMGSGRRQAPAGRASGLSPEDELKAGAEIAIAEIRAGR